MRPLEPRNQQQIIELLTPLMSTEQDRRTLLALTLVNHPLLERIDFSGPTVTYLPAMITALYQFGKLDDGRPALWALLEVTREQVGLDQKHRIDSLRPLFDLPPPPRLDRVFVSYSRKNERYARRLVSDLKDAGLRVWYDRDKLRGGVDWWKKIIEGITFADYFVFCLSPDSIRSQNARDELLNARQRNKPIFAVMLEDCMAELKDEVFAEIDWLPNLHIIDFSHFDRYGSSLRELIQSLPGYTPPDSYFLDLIDPRDLPNPFRGLEPFLEVDAAYFAGREDAVQDLLARVQDTSKPRLLAVIGASGSGKSSLVRAGLIPVLRQELPFWETLIFKPGSSPLNELADRLFERLGADAVSTRERLRENSAHLDDIATELLEGKPDDARFVLVIDQFEEVFTQTSEDERRMFLDIVLHAVTVPGGRVQVILTLRADFFDRLSALPELARLVRENLDIATEMTPDQLRRSIEIPASKVGVVYDEGLVEQILEDVRAQPGSLPLLQYALKELFERRLGRRMTHEAYDALGGVKGALASRADALYLKLTPLQQEVLRRTLLRLVEVGDGVVTRRRVAQSDLSIAGIPESLVNDVLNRLTDYETRLLVASATVEGNIQSQQVFYEVSHEALLTHWSRLASWISENRSDLRLSTEILALARSWDESGRSETSYLLSGGRLANAHEWVSRGDASLLQRAFIDASLIRDQQLQSQRRLGIVVVVGLIMLLLLVGVVFLLEQNQAQNERLNTQRTLLEQGTNVADARSTSEVNLLNAQRVESRFRADQSTRELAQLDQHNALMLAVQSLTNYPHVFTTEGHQALLNALTFPAQEVLSVAHDFLVKGALMNRENTRLLTWGGDVTVRVWKMPNGAPLWVARHDIDVNSVFNSVQGAIWNADETQVLSWGTDGTARVWDAETGAPLLTLKNGGVLDDAFWNADESLILTHAQSQSLRIWDAKTGTELQPFTYESWIRAAGWNADETRLFVLIDKNSLLGSSDDINYQLNIYDAKTSERQMALDVEGFAWNPKHTMYYTLFADQSVKVWDGQTLDEVSALPASSGINDVRWSDDGTLLLTLTDTFVAQVWDAETGEYVWTVQPEADTTRAVFKPDGTQLAAWGGTGTTLHLWNMVNGEKIKDFYHNDALNNVVWNASGTRLLAETEGDNFLVWDITTNFDSIAEAYLEGLSDARWLNDHQVIGYGDESVRVWETEPPAMRLPLTFANNVKGVSWNHSGTAFLIWGNDNRVEIWDGAGKTQLRDLIHHDKVLGATWSADGSHILTWSQDGSAALWDTATGKVQWTLEHDDAIDGAIWNSDESRLLTWSEDNIARLWDAKTGDELKQFTHDDWVLGAAWNSDETQIISWSEDNTARVWDVKTGNRLLTLQHDKEVDGAVWSPDGTRILTWSTDKTARIWDAKTGDQVFIATHNNSIRMASWYPHGDRILVIPNNEGASVWDIERDKIAFQMNHLARVDGFLWSMDKSHVLMWSADAVRLWDAQTGALVMDMPEHLATGAIWNNDGSRILTWTSDGDCIIWNIKTGARMLTLANGHIDPDGAIWNPDETGVMVWGSDSLLLWTVGIDQLLAAGRAVVSNFNPMDNTQLERFLLPTVMPSPTPTLR